MLSVPLNMGMSAAHCQGNVREFQSVWRVVTVLWSLRAADYSNKPNGRLPLLLYQVRCYPLAKVPK